MLFIDEKDGLREMLKANFLGLYLCDFSMLIIRKKL